MLPRRLGLLFDLISLAAALAAALGIAPGLSLPSGPFSGWEAVIVVFALSSTISLAGYRLAVKAYQNRRRAAGRYSRNVLLIGSPSVVAWMGRYFAGWVAAQECTVVGYLSLPPNAADPKQTSPTAATADTLQVPLLGQPSDLGDLLIRQSIQEVVAISAPHAPDWIAEAIHECEYLAVPLRVVPAELLPAKPGELPKLYPDKYLHLPAVEFVAAPANWERLWLKRLIDVVGSIILMVVLSPLMLAIAAAVKVAEPSLPVLYPWRVVGWHGRRFTGYKFRTMVENADELKPTLQSQNEMVGPTFKMQDDPRVTRLGRFLRKYSLDELPQFWSVLKGDMSLVGPRPAFLSEVERYQFWHKRRLSVRPGITCLWQVRGRQRIYQFDDWVRMDLEYIDRWSLGLDLAILLRTIPQVFRGTGV